MEKKPLITLVSKPRLLQLSNNILFISIIIAVIFIFLLRRENTKLNREKAELKSEVQTLTGTMAGPPSAQVGDIVPSFEASSLEGKQIRVVYDGSTAYLLYIFSPTCSECLNQFHLWNQTAVKAKNRKVLGLSNASTETTKAAINMADQSFDILIIPSNSIQRAYRVVAQPMVMLVSPQGQIEWLHYGALTEDKMTELLALLNTNSGSK